MTNTKTSRPLIRALAHPVALVAITVWLLNDHLLKSMVPGIITGKLSDIAGMIVTPLIVAVSIEHVTKGKFVRTNAWFSVILVAFAFTAAKTTTAGHDAYVTVATFLRVPLHALIERFRGTEPSYRETVVLIRDATDLIAIPFGLVSVWLLEKSRPRPPGNVNENDSVRTPEPRSIPSDA